MSKQVQFRFYAELNDFLPQNKKYKSFTYTFSGSPSIKDSIEAVGVPHTEVDLILVNGISVDFNYHLTDGDYISVYPVFESMDISPLLKLRAKPLRITRFILDVHLGKLARKLRMLGFDTLYRNDYSDDEIIDISLKEKRTILTRDRGILMVKSVQRGYWVRSKQTDEQLTEVLNRFDLYSQINAFRRCMVCNGEVRRIDKEKIMDRLLPKTNLFYNEFYICPECDRLYWKGSHYKKMESFIQSLKEQHNNIQESNKRAISE